MSVAEALGKNAIGIIKKYNDYTAAVDNVPTILKTAALLHDMGNPPFGHLGEEIISTWFSNNLVNLYYENQKIILGKIPATKSLLSILNEQQRNDFISFEGNAQLLRLIQKLNGRNTSINLTYATISVCIKYLAKSSEKKSSELFKRKIGYFYSENNFYEEIQRKTGTYDNRNPLTFLLEAADDISYLTSDLEDAMKKEIITIDLLLKELRGIISGNEIVEDLISKIIDYRKIYDGDNATIARKIRLFIKGKFINVASMYFDEKYSDIMQGKFNEELLFHPKSLKLQKKLREILKKYVYKCIEIVDNKIKVHKIMNTLLDNFVTAAVNGEFDETDSKDSLIYHKISNNYIKSTQKAIRELKEITSDDKIIERDKLYFKIQLAIDQICGMTDLYAMETYNNLNVTK